MKKSIDQQPVRANSTYKGNAHRVAGILLAICLICLLTGICQPVSSEAVITLDVFEPEYSSCGNVWINGVVLTTDGTITRISWDWGDGNVADSWFPGSHRYRENGSYTVTVTTFCSTGERESASVSVTVANAEGQYCNYGVMTDLGTLGGDQSVALSINNRGQVVGQSTTSTGEYHAFLWQHGEMTDVGTLGGDWSIAYGINSRGQVVGQSATSTDAILAFLWQDGTMTDLGTLGGAWSIAWAINARGQVVGESRTATGTYHAFLWKDGLMTDLGTLGGSNSAAYGINTRGQVVGTSLTSTGEAHAFLCRRPPATGLGILSTGEYQAVFLDTPGLIEPAYGLQAAMMRAAERAISDADVLVVMVDATRPAQEFLEHRDRVSPHLEGLRGDVTLAINKVDLVYKEALLPLIDQYSRAYAVREIVPISAMKADGTDVLVLGDRTAAARASPPVPPGRALGAPRAVLRGRNHPREGVSLLARR